MKYFKYYIVLAQVILIPLLCVPNAQAEAASGDCKCEVISCGPCESETDIKLYSGKCGENLSRVKSCKKPVCEPVADQDQCFAELGIQNPNKKLVDNRFDSLRGPASALSAYPEIGIVAVSSGRAMMYRENQNVQVVSKGLRIRENDRVVTETDAKVKIIFQKTNDEIHITPDSNVFIQKFQHQNEPEDNAEFKKTVVKLDFGKIRVRLAKGGESYDKEKNTFEVKTKTAVAGVRGTDFVMSYDRDSKASEVDTLSGAVEMMAQNASETSGEPILVSAGEGCTTIAKLDFSEISNLKKIDAKALRLLDQTTEVKEIATSATQDKVRDEERSARNSFICQAPSADFKECAWFCERNPKNEKNCRTDLKEVSCIRRMCGANGLWILPTRMPSSESTQCHGGTEPVKAPCGTYW